MVTWILDVDMSGYTILVSGLPKDVDNDNLQAYFQSKSKSGGGELAAIEIDGDRGEARIEYVDASVAETVLGRTHEYQGFQLTVEECKLSKDQKEECTSILVSGLSDNFTDESLQMYFENTRRSGGGEVSGMEMRGDSAVVTFKSPEDVKRVLARSHEYQGYQLSVQEYKPSTNEVSSILVSGFSEKFTDEALQMYFENTRRSGGGVVTDVQMKGDKAVVTFASADVAKEVLTRTHEYQGCHLTVQEYKKLTDEVASILVSGLSEKITDEALQMYFENTRRSGGGEVTGIDMRGDIAVVTFASLDVAKQVLSRSHAYQGCQLTVQEYKPPQCTSILVSGLSDKFTDEALQMYFENTRNGGGEVTGVELRGHKAVVTFASRDVANRVLSRTHKYQGCQLSVQEYKPSMHESVYILVSDLSDKFTDEALQMYFENTRRSGGGEVSGIKMRGDSAVVTFTSPEVAKRVLARSHEYQGCRLTVQEYKPSIDDAIQEEPDNYNEHFEPEQPMQPSKVVRVDGILEKTTKESLSHLFMNARRSGGGEIENIRLNKVEGFADITFCDYKVAERVSKKRALEFDGANFAMTLKVDTPKDPKRIHVMNISPEMTKESLTLFMELITGEVEVEDVVLGSNSNALVTFRDPPDFKKAQGRCSTRSVEGDRRLEIEQVEKCDCIEVSGLAFDTTKETVLYYFDSSRSGGGGVRDVKMNDSGDKRALVFFHDSSVAKEVVQKQDHVISGRKLKVIPYYQFLGEVSALPGVGKAERTVKVSPQRMLFISEFLHQEFDQILKKNQVKHKWEQGTGELVIGCAEPSMDKETWENSCEAVIAYINQIVTKTIMVTREVWKDVCKEGEKKVVPQFENQVNVIKSDKECSFALTGKKPDVTVLAEQLEDLNSEIKSRVNYEKSKTNNTIPLNIEQIELLRFIGFAENLQTECKDLEVKLSFDDKSINFRGPDAMVKEGNVTVWKTLATMKDVQIELPRFVVDIFRTGFGKEFISQSFKDNAIDAVVHFDTQLVVTAVDRDTARKAENFISQITAEESINLDEDLKRLIKSEKWKEFKNAIQKSKLLKVTEEPAVSTLWIGGIKEKVVEAKEKVNTFFKANVKLHESIPTETGRVKFIFKHKLDAIEQIKDSLKSQSVEITKGSDTNILVSGTKKGIEMALPRIRMIISDIKDRRIDLDWQPGMRKTFVGETGLALLSTIENEQKCIIERCTASQSSTPTSFDAANDSKNRPKLICSYLTPEGKKIALYKGDLTGHQVDVMVNATDIKLKNEGGVSKRILGMGGREIQDQCNAHIRRMGYLSCGEVVVTGGGCLPCKKIIHVASPQWKAFSGHHTNTGQAGGKYQIRELAQALTSTLSHAKVYNSIALPAISAGGCGFPEKVCAETLIQNTMEFVRENPTANLNEVHFVDMKDSVIKAFQAEMKTSFGKEPSFTDLTTPSRDSTKTMAGRRRFSKKDTAQGLGDIKTTPVINITIVEGDLAKEEVEAIVNSVSPELDLRTNPCAKALSDAAGPELQQECKGKGKLTIGEMAVTDGYKLRCKNVFHVAAGEWGNGKGEPVLRSLIQSCLKEADQRKFSSIAFPAIGTGKAGFPRDFVARAFYEEAGSFKRMNPQTTVMDLHLVVFHEDKVTVKAFEKEEKRRRLTQNTSSSSENPSSEASEKATAPTAWQTFKGYFWTNGDKERSGVSQQHTFQEDRSESSTMAKDEKMWLLIFAWSIKDLDGAESRINILADEKSSKKEIKNEAICQLSESQSQRIIELRNKYNTTIQINKILGSIIVRGNVEDVISVTLAINDILKEKTEEEHTRRYAELLAENVQWQYMYHGSWESYDDEINAQIEKAYKDKKPTIAVPLNDDTSSYYEINFRAMTETNVETFEITEVKRRSKGIVLPLHWDPQPTGSDGKELKVCLVPLDPKKPGHAKEYDDVKKAVEKTMPMTIVKIERVQNRSRYRAYAVMKDEMENKSGSNEKKLFHGTASKTCEQINHKGFNRSYCGKNATVFGEGVYFARDASYSARSTYSPPDPSGNRYMYLTSVLVGEYTQGSAGMLEPPPKDPRFPTVTFDSVVDNVSDPSIYVVFHDDQNYPEYLITFK